MVLLCVTGQIGLNLNSLSLIIARYFICVIYSFVKKYFSDELLFGKALCSLIQRRRYRSCSLS